MNNKDDILEMLKKLVKYQYMYEQDALEIGEKTIKTEKDLARIYKKLIDKEVDKIENRENPLT